MPPLSGPRPRLVRLGAYLFFFCFFAAILFITHARFLNVPYYWDEAGQFVPAALDILSGVWIPHSTIPNIHPPAVPAYLAACWKFAGFTPAVTRSAMLLLAALGVLAAFLLAIELSKDARGKPALFAAVLLCATPVFFAQSMLAQLDAPAMLFTALALLWFLQDRIPLAAAACVALVMVKETGAAIPLAFAAWLIYERRWRDAAWFFAPAAALAGWVAYLGLKTGSWAGNSDFVQFNVYYPLAPGRLAAAILRRVYYLFFADLRWVGTAGLIYAWRRTNLFRTRSWKIALLAAGAQAACVTVLGGAVLNRYLLPVMPVLLAAIAAALSFCPRAARIGCSAALLAGAVAGNFITPPYPFAYEDNLTFTAFVAVQQKAAAYLEQRHPGEWVCAMWPLSAELARPYLGYVHSSFNVRNVSDFSAAALDRASCGSADTLAAYSRGADSPYSLLRFAPVRALWWKLYGSGQEGCYKDLPAVGRRSDVDPRFGGCGEEPEVGAFIYIFGPYLGMSGMRRRKPVVEPAEKRRCRNENLVRKDSEHFFCKRVFGDAIVVIECGLRAPADMEGGIDVCFAPFHDFAKLFPVVDRFKIKMLDRRACYYHAVVFLMLDLVEGRVEREQMIGRSVLRGISRSL
jgi:hypothetical protein